MKKKKLCTHTQTKILASPTYPLPFLIYLFDTPQHMHAK